MINPYEQDTDVSDSRYHTLKQACKSDDISTVKSILQSKNAASQDPEQFEPIAHELLQKCFFEAFVNRNFDLGRYLIREAGAKIEKVFAWHSAFHVMPVEAFEFLLQEGWDINSPVSGVTTALSYILPSVALTKWFLEHGADPNLGPEPCRLSSKGPMVPNSGFALNHAACEDPAIAIAIIDLLVQYGARLEDSIPLHLVAECGPHHISHRLTTSSDTSQAAAQESLEPTSTSTPTPSRIPVIKHLLNLGYDPNASDMAIFRAKSHGPPLHWAIRWGRLENARFLLENGADPLGEDRYGRNALEAARGEHEGAPTIRGSDMEVLIMEYI